MLRELLETNGESRTHRFAIRKVDREENKGLRMVSVWVLC